MVYTETKEIKGKKYYYRTMSLRVKDKVIKKRIYLGKELSKEQLAKKEESADQELQVLSSLLTAEEIKELDKIKQDYLKQPKENEENRYEAFCSLFTCDSTNIEGNTLTLQETARLLFEHQVPAKSLREINEVLNHKEAFDYVLKVKGDLSKKLILELHRLVVKNTLKEELSVQVGRYRTMQVYIRGVDWLPASTKEVPKEMRNLLFWYAKNKRKLHPIIIAAYIHIVFEMIHPFIDGNGRVGRLLMNFILHKNKFPMINIPNKKRIQYYKALEEAQVKGNVKVFVRFLVELLREEKVRF
ncbi:MAG: Fic family protein [Candidatus Nanoarchaeia archaeon]